jgi:hypothetical protein
MALMKSRNTALKTSLYITILFISLSNAFIENFGQMGDQINSFVDGLYKNVDSWTDHVINHAKSEECHYICPNGNYLKYFPKRFFASLFNNLSIDSIDFQLLNMCLSKVM